jgi:O-antigen ligase
MPLPLDFFGYLFARSGQLEGYAQNSNAFAFQLLMALAVAIAAWEKPRQEVPRSWLIAAAILLVTLALARSRAGILCALATVAFAPVLGKLPARNWLTRRSLAVAALAAAAVVVLGIAFWGTIDRGLVEPLTHVLRPHADESDALRWQSTALGLQAWLRHPVFGGGLGTFLLDRETAGLPLVVVHSVPIWFLAEMGLVGLAAYGFFVASLAAAGVAALRRHDGHARGLLIVVAVFVLMGLVHDIFFQRTFWFACGLMLVDVARVAPRREEAHSGATEEALDLSGARS